MNYFSLNVGENFDSAGPMIETPPNTWEVDEGRRVWELFIRLWGRAKVALFIRISYARVLSWGFDRIIEFFGFVDLILFH